MTRYDFGDVTLETPEERLNSLFRLGPQVTAYHVRDTFGRIMGRYRRALLAKHGGTRFLRFVQRAIFYRVWPGDKGKRSEEASGRFVSGQMRAASVHRLSEIRLKIWSTSRAALLHETGGTTRAKDGAMAIPIGKLADEIAARSGRAGPGKGAKTLYSPAAVAARIGKRLIRLPGTSMLFAVGPGQEKPEPMFVLAKSVTVPARLGFYATWRAQASDRRALWASTLRTIVQELATGRGRVATAAGAFLARTRAG